MAKNTYYDMLGLGKKFSPAEIDEAFEKIKQKIRYDPALKIDLYEKAYQTLRDPQKRKKYDELLARADVMRSINSGMSSSSSSKKESKTASERYGFYIIAVILLSLIFLVFVLPKLNLFNSFQVGDTLYYGTNGKVFGKVKGQSGSHLYSSGVSLPSYEIETPEGVVKWIPKSEVEVTCVK